MLDFAFLFLEESPPSRLMMIRDNSSEDARGNSNVIEFIRYVSKSSDELSLMELASVIRNLIQIHYGKDSEER